MEENNHKIDTIRIFIEISQGVKLTTKTRDTTHAKARWLYYNLCRELTSASYKQISNFINQDHSTAIHYCSDRCPYPPEWKENLNVLREELGKDIRVLNNNLYSLKALKEEVGNLKKEAIKINRTIAENQEFIRIFNCLNEDRKKDLIFKAKTSLKLQTKI